MQKKEPMVLIKIRDVFTNPESNPMTFFCLPKNSSEWTLDTEGMFTLDSVDFEYDSDEYLPDQVKSGEWVETLEGADFESIVCNASEQIESPTLEQLLKAFIYYYENDAFMEF